MIIAPGARRTIGRRMVRPLLAALNQHGRYAYRAPEFQVDHLVVGGGVVGLSIALALAQRWPDKSTYVIERHAQFGQETSSRNSEVIHAGLYYPANTLKARMCLRGRELLYQRMAQWGAPTKQVGKLIVGTRDDHAYLARLHAHAASLGPLAPPTELLTGDEARALEPDLAPSMAHALWSPRTGIVSVHELMAHLAQGLDTLPSGETPDAEIVYGSSVVRLDPHEPARPASKRGADASQEGWVVHTRTHDASHAQTDALLARVVINACGLNAPRMLNALMAGLRAPQAQWVPMYFAKGSYVSYRGPGTEHVQHLLYPTPHLGAGAHGTRAVHALGTHLTLDLDGHARFGPDLEWLDAPAQDADAEDALGYMHDFWETQLAPSGTDAWLDSMHAAIRTYLPGVQRDGLAPDYAGVRPKLAGPDARAFQDFEVLWHSSRALGQQHVWQRALPASETPSGVLVSLLGIESPGVTSALALAEHVVEGLATRVWGDADPRGRARRYVDDVGPAGLEAWA